uniref:outer dynein arm-docking complex subunit 1-like n=1 Tax=Myxine glutinosa TaxID=7769 RepID=UPI00358FC183
MDTNANVSGEVEKLHKRCRVIVNERQANRTVVRELMCRQRKELSRLEQEREDLLLRLKVVQSPSAVLRDEQQIKNLRVLLARHHELDKTIQQEKDSLIHLDGQIQQMEEKVNWQQREVAGTTSSSLQVTTAQKSVYILQNTLEKEKQGLHVMLKHNGDLRHEIDSLQREQMDFKVLYNRLTKELEKTKKETLSLMDASTAAYVQRQELQNEIIRLQEKDRDDEKHHDNKLWSTQSLLKHERQLQSFLAIKSRERKIQDDASTPEHEHEEEGDMDQQKLLSKGKQKNRNSDESLQHNKPLSEQGQDVPGERDVSGLLQKLMTAESQNFALFNFINEQRAELEHHHAEVEELHKEIENYKKSENIKEQQQRREYEVLEKQHEEAFMQTVQLEDELQCVNNIIEDLGTGIKGMSTWLGCDELVPTLQPRSRTTTTKHPLLCILSIVEQKINELLSMHAYLLTKDQTQPLNPHKAASLLLGHTREIPVQHPQLPLPSLTDVDTQQTDDGEWEEEEPPLSFTDLRNAVVNQFI